MIGDPGVSVGHIGANLWQIVFRHEPQEGEEGFGNRVAFEELRRDLAIFPGVLIGGVHPLGPAPDPKGGLFHDLGRVGVATQMGVEGGDQAIVAQGRAAAQQVGAGRQMGLEQGQELGIAGLDSRNGLRRDAELAHGLTHAAAGHGEDFGLGLVRGAGRRQGGGEVPRQDGAVGLVEVPAIVHGGPQQALAGLEVGDDLRSVLNQGPVVGFENGDDPSASLGNDLGTEAGLTGGPVLEGYGLLDQIGAGLAGIERARRAVEFIDHRISSPCPWVHLSADCRAGSRGEGRVFSTGAIWQLSFRLTQQRKCSAH